jgi:hypothetical protein
MSDRVEQSSDVASSRSFALWFGVLGPPLAWAAHLLLGDGLFELGCAPGFAPRTIYGVRLEFWDMLQTGLFLAVDVAAGVMAMRAYRRLRLPETERAVSNPTVLGRARGMAVVGVASAVIYGALLVFGLLPPFFLRTCGPLP